MYALCTAILHTIMASRGLNISIYRCPVDTNISYRIIFVAVSLSTEVTLIGQAGNIRVVITFWREIYQSTWAGTLPY